MPSSSVSARWTYAFAGGLLALAMIAAVYLVFDPLGGDQGSDGAPAAATPAPPASPGTDRKAKRKDKAENTPSQKPSPAAQPSRKPQPAGEEGVAAVYYLGDTPAGPRLFREFRGVRGRNPLDRAVNGLEGEPLDPDYVRTWSPGAIQAISFDGSGADGLIQVDLASPTARMIPPGMNEAQATAAVQSAVYTLQGAVQARAKVAFFFDGKPVDQVYGVDTRQPLTIDSPLATVNLVSITSPEQGSTQAETMKISGVGNSFEASIGWQITDTDGRVVKRAVTTSEGWVEDRLYPWSDTVNLSKLPAGDYLFTASTDDPSGGTEGTGPAIDTKRFTIG